ncbi:MAG: hypothetical protein Q7T39_00165 [Polaromonas sp.]|nr:hypothetical protein [Polaromonas sp.]
MGSNQLQPSPQMRAEYFIHLNLDRLDPSELKGHESQAIDILAELNHYMNQPGRSIEALRQANQLRRRLQLQLARLRDLIQAHQSATAMTQALAAGHGLDMLHLARVPGKRSRVIRPLPSADNAAPAPQGGEAKGEPAHPQSGEASLQAKR